jgi:hypothetical protein
MTPYAKWLKSVWKNVWKTFILNFNKSASIYKEEEKLEATAQAGGGCVWWMRWVAAAVLIIRM